MRNWLQQKDLIAQWTKSVIIRLEEVFQDDDHKNRTKWRTYLPYVRYALISDEASKDDETRIYLSQRYGQCLLSDGRYDEAKAPFLEVLEMRKIVFEQEHPSTLISMANLASTYQNQGRWKEAEDLGVQVIETRKRMLGQEHPDTLTSMANLALTYRKQERWKEAEELQTTELEICKRVLGQEHPDTLNSMANLALIWKGNGREMDGLKLMKQCVEMRARILGANHPDTLSSSEILLEWEMEK